MQRKMLGCVRPESEEAVISQNIEKELFKIYKKFDNAIKILLLGTAESGKTTIIKQMKILHITGYTDEERAAKVSEIRQNLHESIYVIAQHMTLLNVDCDHQNCDSKRFILNVGPNAPSHFDQEYREHVRILWTDSGIHECYRRSNEYQLLDSAKYFLDRLDEIASENYVPSTEDILHSRKVTLGVHEIVFKVKIPKSMGGGLQEFRMFDVGGQRDQRKKWMLVFEGIQAVLFLISCGDFDQTLREDPSRNRLTESLCLFNGVWHNRFLIAAGIIVFLNKQDIMESKIRRGKCIGHYFPDYESFRLTAKDGDIFDECNKTRCFIRQKLLDITSETPRRLTQMNGGARRECYFHFTVATDTDNIRRVFHDVHSMILTENLTKVGLM